MCLGHSQKGTHVFKVTHPIAFQFVLLWGTHHTGGLTVDAYIYMYMRICFCCFCFICVLFLHGGHLVDGHFCWRPFGGRPSGGRPFGGRAYLLTAVLDGALVDGHLVDQAWALTLPDAGERIETTLWPISDTSADPLGQHARAQNVQGVDWITSRKTILDVGKHTLSFSESNIVFGISGNVWEHNHWEHICHSEETTSNEKLLIGWEAMHKTPSKNLTKQFEIFRGTKRSHACFVLSYLRRPTWIPILISHFRVWGLLRPPTWNPIPHLAFSRFVLCCNRTTMP